MFKQRIFCMMIQATALITALTVSAFAVSMNAAECCCYQYETRMHEARHPVCNMNQTSTNDTITVIYRYGVQNDDTVTVRMVLAICTDTNCKLAYMKGRLWGILKSTRSDEYERTQKRRYDAVVTLSSKGAEKESTVVRMTDDQIDSLYVMLKTPQSVRTYKMSLRLSYESFEVSSNFSRHKITLIGDEKSSKLVTAESDMFYDSLCRLFYPLFIDVIRIYSLAREQK